MLDDDIAPELHRMTARCDIIVNLQQKVEVHAPFTTLLNCCSAAPLTEVEGLIAADVEHVAGEVRQELVVQAADELRAAGVNRSEAECTWTEAPRRHETSRHLG